MPPEPKALNLTTLKDQCKVSPRVLAGLAEAASVMLARHEHKSPCDGTWSRDSDTGPILVVWEAPDEMAVVTHGNLKDATEDGAYAVAVSAANALGFEVQGRTKQGSGADFWMTRRGGDVSQIYHLEVSGISERGAPTYRLGEKTRQGQGGLERQPGVAVIFRFRDVQLRSQTWR